MAVIYPQNSDLTKSLKSARKTVPQSARLSAGGEVQSLFGQCPNRGDAKFKGASLTTKVHFDFQQLFQIIERNTEDSSQRLFDKSAWKSLQDQLVHPSASERLLSPCLHSQLL